MLASLLFTPHRQLCGPLAVTKSARKRARIVRVGQTISVQGSLAVGLHHIDRALPMDEPLPERYKEEECLGHGSFGEVYRAYDKQKQQHVAVKRIYSKRAVRSIWGGDSVTTGSTEADVLQRLHHDNVLKLYDVIEQQFSLLLVLELADADLGTLLDPRGAVPRPLAPDIAKSIMLQLLKGLAACHAQGVLHRDLKPSNLLFVQGQLKLADFGQCRLQPQPGEAGRMSNDVCTRWYRAPELLYGSTEYGPGVDIWSAGCIFAELLGTKPVFQGHSDIDQLAVIQQQMGTITEATWPGVARLPDYGKLLFKELPARSWQEALPGCSEQAYSLLQQLLQYAPDQRIAAVAALQHPYFTDGRPEPAPYAKLAAAVREAQEAAVQSRHTSVADCGAAFSDAFGGDSGAAAWSRAVGQWGFGGDWGGQASVQEDIGEGASWESFEAELVGLQSRGYVRGDRGIMSTDVGTDAQILTL